MNNQPENPTPGALAIVEDLFLTSAFLIKGRLPNKTKRLSNMLEDHERSFLTIHDATLVALRSGEVIRTPKVLANMDEVIFAHELVEVAGDSFLKRLAQPKRMTRIRAFFSGSVQFELAGNVEKGAYDVNQTNRKRFFVLEAPQLRGLNLEDPELRILKDLEYAIVRKDKLSYIYDFS